MGFDFASKGLFINGEWVRPLEFDDVVNPATEDVIIKAPVGGLKEAEYAIEAARKSFDSGEWRSRTPKERQSVLQNFLNAIQARAPEIIEMIVQEAGATRMLAEFLQYGIPMQHAQHAVDICTRPATTPLPVETTPNPMGDGTTMLGAGVLQRAPVGVVTCITPYNFPFFLNIGKIIPAMAVGNSVILKPSPYTPLEALFLGEIAEQVGLPKGVLNIVTGGVDASALLTADKRVDLISFTGSDTVGARIQAQAAPTLKRCLMELGGKSAMIVRSDANVMEAAMAGLSGFTIHCGQGCALLTRHLVHNSIKAEYVATMKAMAEQVKVGNPADPSVQMGPLIRETQRKRTEDYVQIAQDGGAKLVTGGKRPEGLSKGFYYTPTFFDDVTNDMRIAQEEVFGPIGAVIGYDTDEEAVALANQSEFGLAGAIYTRDVGKAYEMALQIETGGVMINGGTGKMNSTFPFGGIKRSGYGREYGEEGLNEFTYMKTIAFHGG